MLYIFDLGNVIVDIDFKRVLGVWSKLSSVPLATLNERFTMGEVFQQHERGEISDEDFAHQLSDEMGISLSFEQFAEGWQAIFVALRPEVIDIMNKLRREGIVLLCYRIPTAYIVITGQSTILKSLLLLITCICHRIWECVNRRPEFISMY